jgi:hypothetical protein
MLPPAPSPAVQVYKVNQMTALHVILDPTVFGFNLIPFQ